jgi:glycosyltransferase involved in cell wall biosynthesis
MVKALGREFSFSVFCSDKDHDGSPIKVYPDRWLQDNEGEVFYASSEFLKSGNVINLIRERQPQILFINGLYSWYFNILPLLKTQGLRKIVSVRGMLHPGALSQKTFKKKLYLSIWKLLKLHKKNEFHATTFQEKAFIEEVFGKDVKIWIASNFPKALPYNLPPPKLNVLILVSVALISPMKNHLLVLEALRKVTASIEYHIYGPVKDHPYWAQCEALITTMPPNVKVFYKGEVVPHRVADALTNAHVFILPSKSENFGHAIYEAMTAGKPVITSHHTPWNNLQEKNAGMNVSTENVEEIIVAIEYFASMRSEKFEACSKLTRQYALAAIDVEEIKKKYIQMFTNDTTAEFAQ